MHWSQSSEMRFSMLSAKPVGNEMLIQTLLPHDDIKWYKSKTTLQTRSYWIRPESFWDKRALLRCQINKARWILVAEWWTGLPLCESLAIFSCPQRDVDPLLSVCLFTWDILSPWMNAAWELESNLQFWSAQELARMKMIPVSSRGQCFSLCFRINITS